MSLADRALFLLITGFGTGLAPVASGTFGTLPAVAIGWLVQYYFFPADHRGLAIALLVMAVVLLLVGCSTSAFVERVLQTKDPKPFVLDEIVGYFIALSMLAFLQLPGVYSTFATFFFFRLFDVIKPTPARQLEAVPGAPGIMLDDVFAGIYAGIVVILLSFTDLY